MLQQGIAYSYWKPFIAACQPEVEERHVGRESSDIRTFREWKR